MSGFAIRRFVLQNVSAVAAYCPSATLSRIAIGVMSGSYSPSNEATDQSGAWFRRLLVGDNGSDAPGNSTMGLVTPEEMNYIRRRRNEDAEESRVVLATRPTRSIIRGVGGGVLNVLLSMIVSPLIFLSVTLEKIRLSNGVSGLVIGPLFGLLWSCIFFSVAWYAAFQQVVMSLYYSTVAAPLYYCVSRRTPLQYGAAGASAAPRAWIWGSLACRFESPQGNAGVQHPMLGLHESPDVLRERATRRLAKKDKKKEDVSYSRSKKGPGGVSADDYYGLLGLSKDCTQKEVKEAYNHLVLKLHPDRNPSPDAAQQFDRVTKAYRVLSNAEKRRKFDLGGAKGVEDLGAKKREGVRAVFGGEDVQRIAGDVFMGSFSQRVIDGLDYTQEELAVSQQRMLQACRDEILNQYLCHYKGGAESATPGRSESSGGQWKGSVVAVQLRKMLNVGLAKEVLFCIGKEYERVLAYYDTEATTVSTAGGSSASLTELALPKVVASRVSLYLSSTGPHRWAQRRKKLRYLAAIRSDTFKNSDAMVDLAWYTSVGEIEATARWVAFSILYEPSLSPEEAQRRRQALAALAATFVQYGQEYKGASKATMDQLMTSLREYQQQRQREKDNQ